MTVFSGKQIVPVNYEAEVSHHLLEACLSGDLRSALDCIADPSLDINFVGAVCLKSRRSEVVLHDESAGEVRVEYEEFKTDVTALFLAVHSGNVDLVKELLVSIGADVNQKLFRGFATTAAVREGHLEILEILLKAGASQPACEEALLEASCHGRARVAEILMGSDLIRPHVAVHALVTSCCRGFADVVDTLMKCGVDFNATDRLLLLSSKPSLHTNVDCSALVAAVVSRQVDVVRMLLKAGAETDVKVRLGAWSWDTTTGEEFRVGAGLADPYGITWCAVEYFEATGAILRMLLQHYFSPNNTHLGRTLLHHAILCGNEGAIKLLLSCGADAEVPVKTLKAVFRPIHMAARLSLPAVLKILIQSSCDLNSRTDSGDTALMICANYRDEECLKVLAMSGADFGLANNAGQSALSIASTNRWFLGFQQAVLEAIKSGIVPVSSNVSIFSPLFFVAQAGDAEALQVLINSRQVADLDYQDENGFTAVMFAALHGRIEAFRVLVHAGADVKLQNKVGETAISLSELSQNRDLFEKVMLEYALEKGNRYAGGFCALHCAARHGDIVAAKLLTSRGYDVNVPDGDGYTPLMLAARGGHKSMCQLLISCGADCELKNARGETAASLARKYGIAVEDVILDEVARKLVLRGSHVQKHTKSGNGVPHGKEMRMVVGTGVLSWGKSSRRNVVCRDVEIGPSVAFRRKREKKGDGEESGLFRVVTTKNREVHFVCDGGMEMAQLWVRGIKLVTREAICC
ncbi:Putative ankyrin repeat protein RF_0381 [Linum perenne]